MVHAQARPAAPLRKRLDPPPPTQTNAHANGKHHTKPAGNMRHVCTPARRATNTHGASRHHKLQIQQRCLPTHHACTRDTAKCQHTRRPLQRRTSVKHCKHTHNASPPAGRARPADPQRTRLNPPPPTQKTAHAHGKHNTSSHETCGMPAQQPGVPPARVVPAGITRCRHSSPACQRLMHSRRQHANKAGGNSTPASPADHRRQAGQAHTTPAGQTRHSNQGITHRPQACSFCDESLQILCRFPQKSTAIFGETI